VAEGLLRIGTPVVVIDNDSAAPFRRVLAESRVPVIDGDCTQRETLVRAGMVRARALIVTISHDMVSLQTALTARDLNPSARIVIRLFNLRLGRHLRNLPAAITAISLSAAAAPVFILAARCNTLRGAFRLADTNYAVGRIVVPETPAPDVPFHRWRSIGLVPLALVAPDGSARLCPPADQVPAPGSVVMVAAEPASLEALGDQAQALARALAAPEAFAPSRDVPRTSTVSAFQRLRNLYHIRGAFWRQANVLLRRTLLVLISLLMLSVFIFHFFMSLSYLNAFYFTVTLITTVGLGDITLLHAPPAVKLYGTFVMLGGVTLMAVIFALITEFVINERLDALAGARASRVRDHYIVAGLGAVGFRVASDLHEAGEAVLAIESTESSPFVPQLRALGVPVVIGDAAMEDTLHRAQIARARACIAVTNNDLSNIEAALNARALAPDTHVVLRVFDPDLALQARRSLGIPAAFSPARIGASVLIAAAHGHEVPQVFALPLDQPEPVELFLEHLPCAQQGDGLCGYTVAEVLAARGGAAILLLPARQPGATAFAPALATRLEPGDVLVLASPAQPLSRSL
jgi:Trk K+ transport system NAD-binding subunit